MVIKIGKKESRVDAAKRLKGTSVKRKKINWDKYFGKIKVPVDAIGYQKKMRNEWR